MAASHPVLCGSIAGRPGVFGVAMHTAAYRALGLDWGYVAFACDDSEGACRAMRSLGIRGLGVTMPHKVRIIDHLDRVSADALAIGAVNTIVNDDGRLTGHNVDWQGAVAAVREAIEPAGRRAAVVGAGGGARAIAFGLIKAGAEVTLFNRSPDAGAALAARLGCGFGGTPEALVAAGRFDLLCHATPVGFHDPAAMLIPAAILVPPLVVFDAVPVPITTRLLATAARQGCTTVAGIRMQLHQAALQVALYTGRSADLAVMEAALRAAIDPPTPAGRTA